ncbi:MAG: DUF3786 domain-containing protein [Desulfobacteraceae bacterium]|nr:DUF3786 domain-containing protein [Desulfobacteraceae bacterium]
MTDNYTKIISDNLDKLSKNLSSDLTETLPGTREGDSFTFNAFGETCIIRPDQIILGKDMQTGPVGIILSLCALHAKLDTCILNPLKAFKDFPNSMPYAGAFTTHTEHILIPYVEKIEKKQEQIIQKLGGHEASEAGDFSFIVYPLPKIALCYIFYAADDEFPASVTCLYSNNASAFLPIDALADVGEYTSRKIEELVN